MKVSLGDKVKYGDWQGVVLDLKGDDPDHPNSAVVDWGEGNRPRRSQIAVSVLEKVLPKVKKSKRSK